MAKVHPNLAVPSLPAATAMSVITADDCSAKEKAAEATGDEEPVVLTVWRKSLLFNCRGFTYIHGGGGKSTAHVAPCGVPGTGGYEVEGSYLRRRCTVYDEKRRAVAEVQPKEAVGTDVFRLVVRPGMEVSAAMAVVLALDEMFGKPSLLRTWSS
ncbi:hypothetical protein ABZP36_031019 [Zizania latifolia]